MNRVTTTLLWICPTVVVAASLGALDTPRQDRVRATQATAPSLGGAGTEAPLHALAPAPAMAERAAAMARHGLPVSPTDAWRFQCPMPCHWQAAFAGRP